MTPLPPPAVEREPCIIHCGDGLTGLRSLKGGSVDVICTSPPYNIGKRYSLHNDRMPEREYLAWQRQAACQFAWALAGDGSLFLNLGGKVSDPSWPFRILQEYTSVLRLQNTFVWVKSLAIDGLTRGHYTPIGSGVGPHPYSGFEYVFHLTHSGRVPLDRCAVGVPYADKANLGRGTRGQNGDVHDAGNVWFLPYRTIQNGACDRPHPASYPPELAERCLRLHGLSRIRLASDPFLGIGSTAVACARLGVPFVGWEIDPAYCETARRSLQPPDAGPGGLG